MEYFIILAVVVAITALSVSAFLGKAKESGEEVFNKAVTRMLGVDAGSDITIKFGKMTDLSGDEVGSCSGKIFTVSQEIWEQLESGNHSYIKCLICQCQCNLADAIYIFEEITSSENGSWLISGGYKFKKSEVQSDCGT